MLSSAVSGVPSATAAKDTLLLTGHTRRAPAVLAQPSDPLMTLVRGGEDVPW